MVDVDGEMVIVVADEVVTAIIVVALHPVFGSVTVSVKLSLIHI